MKPTQRSRRLHLTQRSRSLHPTQRFSWRCRRLCAGGRDGDKTLHPFTTEPGGFRFRMPLVVSGPVDSACRADRARVRTDRSIIPVDRKLDQFAIDAAIDWSRYEFILPAFVRLRWQKPKILRLTTELSARLLHPNCCIAPVALLRVLRSVDLPLCAGSRGGGRDPASCRCGRLGRHRAPPSSSSHRGRGGRRRSPHGS